ncbi:hypothetical protein BC826DRAFT_1034233 [Russula brevipes]|nr:hypothetical protein BC826DRAFT_1034233 [Russula brevipes]
MSKSCVSRSPGDNCVEDGIFSSQRVTRPTVVVVSNGDPIGRKTFISTRCRRCGARNVGGSTKVLSLASGSINRYSNVGNSSSIAATNFCKLDAGQ